MCLQLTCDVDSKLGFSKNQKLGIPRSKRHSQARERMVLKSDHLHQIGIITNEEAFSMKLSYTTSYCCMIVPLTQCLLTDQGPKTFFLSSNF